MCFCSWYWEDVNSRITPGILPASHSRLMCVTWEMLTKGYMFLFNIKFGVTSVILNVKPLHGFLVGFICPCFYFQFIMNSVVGKSLLYFAHLFFAIIIIMLSRYEMCFIIIFLSRSATLASASWQINCFYHLYLRFVMHLHFTALFKDEWQKVLWFRRCCCNRASCDALRWDLPCNLRFLLKWGGLLSELVHGDDFGCQPLLCGFISDCLVLHNGLIENVSLTEGPAASAPGDTLLL